MTSNFYNYPRVLTVLKSGVFVLLVAATVLLAAEVSRTAPQVIENREAPNVNPALCYSDCTFARSDVLPIE